MAHTWVCKQCGSEDVISDATASWNVSSQRWEVVDVLDGEYCYNCDNEARLVKKELSNDNDA